MKKIITRTTTAIVLALTMLLALVGGLLFIKNEVKMADAATVQPTVKYTTDATSFVAGSTFKLTVSITAPGMVYSVIQLHIGPNFASGAYDTTNLGYLTLSNPSINPDIWSEADKKCTNNSNANDTASLYYINLSGFKSGKTVYVDDASVVFTADIKIADNVPAGTDFTIGCKTSRSNYVTVQNGTDVKDKTMYYGGSSTDVFNLEPLVFKTKVPSSNAKLSEIKVGQGEESATNVYQTLDDKTDGTNLDDTFSIVVNDPTAPLTVIPTSVEGVKSITLKPGDVVVSDGKGDVTIPANGVVTIEVLAEDGITKETYTLNVKVVGASLTALIAASDSTLAGVTKKDLQGTFSSSTLDYEVVVPDDGAKVVTVTPTISTGNYANNTAELEKTGAATLSATSVQSGSQFTVSNIETGNTVTIKVSADDSAGHTSEKTYTLTFKVVKTDTDFTMVVKGRVNTTKVFSNSATKAAAENPAVDYYYAIVGETGGRCTVVITPPDSAEVTVNGTNYAAPGVDLSEGTHTVTVTAEAGNSVTKKVKIVNYVPLELKDDVEADFIFERTETEDGETYYYRETYKANNMVHGLDDVDFERVVIGQLRESQTIKSLTEIFKNKNSIRIYDAYDGCMWDCGNIGADTDEDSFNDTDYVAVGTGWYVQYIVNGKVEETIYISVLGDIDGSGFIDMGDVAEVGMLIKKSATMSDYSLEARLAGYITASGDIAGATIDAIQMHLNKAVYMHENF